jgi:hypothetical protein
MEACAHVPNHLDVVPPELLNPSVEERRRADRGEAARLLDGFLRRLAHREALCRRVLGRLAHAFLRRAGHHELGFARLGDYTRERLGVSAREVQDLARVAHRLERLPLTARAFAEGGLPWSHVRLLASVAEPQTELRWLIRAAGSARDLADHIRERRHVPPDEETEPVARFAIRCPRAARAAWLAAVELARRMSGAELAPAAAAEAIAAEALSGAPAPETADSTPAPHVAGARHAVDPPEDLDWDAVEEVLPAAVAELAMGCEHLGSFALDARLREAQRAMQRLDWQTGRLLHLMGAMHLYRPIGFPSLSAYVEARLGFSSRKARSLVAVDRRTAAVPELGIAYREGRLSWLRTLVLAPVADPAAASAWIARAAAVTLRRLVAEVEWALETAEAGRPALPPPRGLPLRLLVERQMCAHAAGGPGDAAVTFSGPASVVALFESAVGAWRRAGEPRWRAFARLLEHVRAEWSGQPAHRDPVFARDGWRCAAPACGSRGNLHDHHLVFRSRGGTNARDNRVTVCAWHHLRGIHGGRVRAHGIAPDAVTWQLGCRPAGAPLMVAIGDSYVSGAPADG